MLPGGTPKSRITNQSLFTISLNSFISLLTKPKPPLLRMSKETRASWRHSQNRSTSVVLLFLFSFAVLHLHQLTEHGSDGSFETTSVQKTPKNTSDGHCGRCEHGPRCGVPGSEGTFEGEMSKGKTKGQENVTSSLLSNQENERLVELLGRRCVVRENTSCYKLK